MCGGGAPATLMQVRGLSAVRPRSRKPQTVAPHWAGPTTTPSSAPSFETPQRSVNARCARTRRMCETLPMLHSTWSPSTFCSLPSPPTSGQRDYSRCSRSRKCRHSADWPQSSAPPRRRIRGGQPSLHHHHTLQGGVLLAQPASAAVEQHDWRRTGDHP